MPLSNSVYCIGLGRTGTRSFVEAMRILGAEKVSHNPWTLEEVIDSDAAAEGACLACWRDVLAVKRNSLFVLTVRDSFAWVRSCLDAICQYDWRRFAEGTKAYERMRRNRVARYGWFVKDDSEDNIEQRLLSHFYHYNNYVMQFFSGERLLVMDITAGHGWDKLCPFLGVDIPDVEFPRVD